jgi:ABC-type uncharacterized transport system substrate-binding protein
MHINRIHRREFITLLGGAAAAPALLWSARAQAQQAGRLRRVGVLVSLAENDPEAKVRFEAFRQGFERLGWFEGRNVHFDFRYAPAGAHVQAIAQELVRRQPEVILAQGTPISAALKQETRRRRATSQLVFVGNVDPVGSGFVASLARPGGNLTDFMSLEASITGKWMGMLKEIAPNLVRAALVSNPKTIPFHYFFTAGEAAAERNSTSGSSISPTTGVGQRAQRPMRLWVKSPPVRGVQAPVRSQRESPPNGPWNGRG